MIIAIDGPAGAGKSTVTRRLAEELGFQFLDTGAMYRAVTWAALQRGVNLENESALAALAETISVRFVGEQVFVDDQDVTEQIRDPHVTRNVVAIANAIAVRAHLVNLQREIGATGNFVCEGRDQGTVAFPDAICKIYLTASDQHRAQRRIEQLQNSGIEFDYDQLMREQNLRDQQDLSRPVGRLQKANDAIEVDTDNKTIEDVVAELLAIVLKKITLN